MPIKYDTIEQVNNKKNNLSKLTAIRFGDKVGTNNTVICRCECGKECKLILAVFIHGSTISCGCYKTKLLHERKKYSHVIKKLRGVYDSMMQRCYKEYSTEYKNYGARGVIVCDEWKNKYQNFLTWALENGWYDGLELDKDSKGNGMLYSPDTCCFVTHRVNKKYRRSSLFFIYNGEELWLPEIAIKYNIPESRLRGRLKQGFSISQAINTPFRKHKKQTA